MENLWENKIDYIGVQLTPEEASLISRVLGNLSFNQRKKFLSQKEEELYSELYIAFSA
jgi:hypothetical protein